MAPGSCSSSGTNCSRARCISSGTTSSGSTSSTVNSSGSRFSSSCTTTRRRSTNGMCRCSSSGFCVRIRSSSAHSSSTSLCGIRGGRFCARRNLSSIFVSWRFAQATSFLFGHSHQRLRLAAAAATAASFSTFSGPACAVLGCRCTRSGSLQTDSSTSFFSCKPPLSFALSACSRCAAAAGASFASPAAHRPRHRYGAPLSAAEVCPAAAATPATAAIVAAASADAAAPPPRAARGTVTTNGGGAGGVAAAALQRGTAAARERAEEEDKAASACTAAAKPRRRMQSGAGVCLLPNTVGLLAQAGTTATGRAAANRNPASGGRGSDTAVAGRNAWVLPCRYGLSASPIAAGSQVLREVPLPQQQQEPQQCIRLSLAAAVLRRGLTAAASTGAAAAAAAVAHAARGAPGDPRCRADGAAAAAAAAREATGAHAQETEGAEHFESALQPRPLFLRYALSQQQLLQRVLPLLQSTDASFLTDVLLSLHELPYVWPAVAAAAEFKHCRIVTPVLPVSPLWGDDSSSNNNNSDVSSSSSNNSNRRVIRESDCSSSGPAAATPFQSETRNWRGASMTTAAAQAAAATAGAGVVDRPRCSSSSNVNESSGGLYYREYLKRLRIDEQHMLSLVAALRNGRDLQLLLLLSLLPAAAAGPARPCHLLLIPRGGSSTAAAAAQKIPGESSAKAAEEPAPPPAVASRRFTTAPAAVVRAEKAGALSVAAGRGVAEAAAAAEEEKTTATAAQMQSGTSSSKTHAEQQEAALQLSGRWQQQQQQLDEGRLQSEEQQQQQERQSKQDEDLKMLSVAVTDCLPLLLAAFHPQRPGAKQWDVVELLLLHITRAALSLKQSNMHYDAAPPPTTVAVPTYNSSSPFPSPPPSPLSTSAAAAPSPSPPLGGLYGRAALLSPSAAAAAGLRPSLPVEESLHHPHYHHNHHAAAPPPPSLSSSAVAAPNSPPAAAPLYFASPSTGPPIYAAAAGDTSFSSSLPTFSPSSSSPLSSISSSSSATATAAITLRPEIALWLQHVALCLSPYVLRFNPQLPLHLAVALQAAGVPWPFSPAARSSSSSSFFSSFGAAAAAGSVRSSVSRPLTSSSSSSSSPVGAAAPAATYNPSFSSDGCAAAAVAASSPWSLRKAASPSSALLQPPLHYPMQQQQQQQHLLQQPQEYLVQQQQQQHREQQRSQQHPHAVVAAGSNSSSEWMMPWDITQHIGSVAILHQLHLVQPFIWGNVKWEALSAATVSRFFRDVFDSAHVELSTLAMERAFVAVQQKFFFLQLPDVENLLQGIRHLQMLTQEEKQRSACSSAAILAPLWRHVHRLLPAASTKLVILATQVFSHEVFIAAVHATGAARLQAHFFGRFASECEKQRPHAAVFAEGGVWWRELLQLLFSRAYFWSLEEWVAVFRMLEPLVAVQQLQQAGLYGSAAAAAAASSSSFAARRFVPPPPLVVKMHGLLSAAFGTPQQQQQQRAEEVLLEAAAAAAAAAQHRSSSSDSSCAEGRRPSQLEQQQQPAAGKMIQQQQQVEEDQQQREEAMLLLLQKRLNDIQGAERKAFQQQLRLVGADSLVDLLVGFATYGYCNMPLQQLTVNELISRMQQQQQRGGGGSHLLSAAALCRLLSVVQMLQQQELHAGAVGSSSGSSSSALLEAVVRHVKLLQLDRTEIEELLALAVALSQQQQHSVGLTLLLHLQKHVERRLLARLSPSPAAAAAGAEASATLRGAEEAQGEELASASAFAAAGECVPVPLLPLLLLYMFCQQTNFAGTAATLPRAAAAASAAAVSLGNRCSSLHSPLRGGSSSSSHQLLSPLTSCVRLLVSELLSPSLSPFDALLLLSPLCAMPSLSAVSPRCFPPTSPLLLPPPLPAAAVGSAAAAELRGRGRRGEGGGRRGAAGEEEERGEEQGGAASGRREAAATAAAEHWRVTGGGGGDAAAAPGRWSRSNSSRWWWWWAGDSRCSIDERSNSSSSIERIIAANRARLRKLCCIASTEMPYSPMGMLRVAAVHALQQTYEKQLLLHASSSNQPQQMPLYPPRHSTIIHVPLLVRLLRLLHVEEDPTAAQQLFDLLGVADFSSLTPQLLLELLTAFTVARLRLDAVINRLCSWYCEHLQQEAEKQQQHELQQGQQQLGEDQLQQEQQQQEPSLPQAAADALLAEVLLQLSALNYVHEPLLAVATSRCCAALLSPPHAAAAGGEACAEATRTWLRLLFGIFSLTHRLTPELVSCFRVCAQRVYADVQSARRREAECRSAPGDATLRCTYTAEEFRWLYEMYLWLLLRDSTSFLQLENDVQLQHFLLSDLPRQMWLEREKQQREVFLMGDDYPQIAAALRRANLQRMQPLVTGICFCHFAAAPAAAAAANNSSQVKGVALFCVEEKNSLAAWTIDDEAETPLCVGEGQRLVFRASNCRNSSSNSNSSSTYSSSSGSIPSSSSRSSRMNGFFSFAAASTASAAKRGLGAAAAGGSRAVAAAAEGREVEREGEEERREGETAAAAVCALKEGSSFTQARQALPFGEAQRKINHLKAAGWVVIPLFLQQWRELQTDAERDEFLRVITSVC